MKNESMETTKRNPEPMTTNDHTQEPKAGKKAPTKEAKPRKTRKPAKPAAPDWYIDLRTFEEVGYTHKKYKEFNSFDQQKYRCIRLLLKTRLAPMDLEDIFSELQRGSIVKPYPPFDPEE